MSIPILTEIDTVRSALSEVRSRDLTVGLVPTMGALHAGHAELIRVAVQHADYVVVSIFVNPIQFGPNEDFERYPRTLDADVELCETHGAAMIFHPNVETMYPEPSLTTVSVKEMDQPLCGAGRVGHFAGVCTVVSKLFHIVQPDIATFGEKDAQQLRIIERMVSDLNVPVKIVRVPTVREADGLAMSSRNRYLSAEERTHAPRIRAAIQEIADAISRGERDVALLEGKLRELLSAIPNSRVEYAKVVDSRSLMDVAVIERSVLIAVAVHLGTTRLIDNLTVEV